MFKIKPDAQGNQRVKFPCTLLSIEDKVIESVNGNYRICTIEFTNSQGVLRRVTATIYENSLLFGDIVGNQNLEAIATKISDKIYITVSHCQFQQNLDEIDLKKENETIDCSQISTKKWPSLTEYRDALTFEGSLNKYKHLKPVKANDGEFVFTSGNFAVVFKMVDPEIEKYYALKCFTRDCLKREESYQLIKETISNNFIPHLVNFEYLNNEIWVNSSIAGDGEYPVLLMDWIEAPTMGVWLNRIVERHDKISLQKIAFEFDEMALWLLEKDYAHGDLKTENILVHPYGKLRLIDYDGMFTPGMENMLARENGSPGFRHPARNQNSFGPWIDDFNILLISLCLHILYEDPEFGKDIDFNAQLIFTEEQLNSVGVDQVWYNIDKLRYNKAIEQRLALLKHACIYPSNIHIIGLDCILKIKNNINNNCIFENYIERNWGLDIEMIAIHGSSFLMGNDNEGNFEKEQPLHKVTVNDFYISKYQITEYQWEILMGNDFNLEYEKYGKKNIMVDSLNWDSVQRFIQILNKITGKKYRLPSEAEWEYAAKDCINSYGNERNDYSVINLVPHYKAKKFENYEPRREYYKVDIFEMNSIKLEFCMDMYHDNYIGAPNNGSSWNTPMQEQIIEIQDDDYILHLPIHTFRVGRGGPTPTSRCSIEKGGFRLVCDLKEKLEIELPNCQKKKNDILNKDSLFYKKENYFENIESINIEMVAIKGGVFKMGSEEEDSLADEKPLHNVKINDFYLGKYLISKYQWYKIMGIYESEFLEGEEHPIEANWYYVQIFLNKLQKKTGKKYRLPTEAEWEFAARGGLCSKYLNYSGSNNINNVAWYDNNSEGSSHKIGTKYPNELGIHDLSGNLWEWCNDWYGPYLDIDQSDPKGPEIGPGHVIRGGSWNSSFKECRSTARNKEISHNTRYYWDNISQQFLLEYSDTARIGFRIALNYKDIFNKFNPPTKKNFKNYVEKTFNSNIHMVAVKGGTFLMGNDNEKCNEDEKPLHKVKLNDFYIGKYPITKIQWLQIMQGYYYKSIHYEDWYPVTEKSIETINEFIKVLNNCSGKNYRLPTEAEWEYAAKGGKKSKNYSFAGSNDINKVAWYKENSKGFKPVGQKEPNELGLYDMSGNIYELCSDYYENTFYSISPLNNPKGSASGEGIVKRGGCWKYEATYCSISCRSYISRWMSNFFGDNNEDTGFRLVCEVDLD